MCFKLNETIGKILTKHENTQKVIFYSLSDAFTARLFLIEFWYRSVFWLSRVFAIHTS